MVIKASRCAFPQPKRHLLLRSRSCAPPRAAKEAKSSEGLKNFARGQKEMGVGRDEGRAPRTPWGEDLESEGKSS